MSAHISTSIQSWGRVHRGSHHFVEPSWLSEVGPLSTDLSAETGSVIAHGLGRSYGDSALNLDHGLVRTTRLDRILHFDREAGILRAEAGASLDDLLKVIVPTGWFLPVTPGTKFVTLGGAVPNDVHGKNHHQVGTFGCHVQRLALWRSDRGIIECSTTENDELFKATIGGLGLTGIILWVEIKLTGIPSAYLEVENERFQGLDGFFDLSDRSKGWDYTVAWVDTIAKGRKLGRGVFSRGRFSGAGVLEAHDDGGPTFPIEAPSFALNRISVGAFNALYYHKPSSSYRGLQHYDPFFYPLDRLKRWNRLYGRRGFYQWQCAVPKPDQKQIVEELLKLISASGQASFLAVLKTFGDTTSPGLLSFPMEGATLALDFPNRGEQTLALLTQLDRVVETGKGRLYPAKDGRLPARLFKLNYPGWEEVERMRDPVLMSSFWRRILSED